MAFYQSSVLRDKMHFPVSLYITIFAILVYNNNSRWLVMSGHVRNVKIRHNLVCIKEPVSHFRRKAQEFTEVNGFFVLHV